METGEIFRARGLTLVELCVALGILALTAALAWPRWTEIAGRETRYSLQQKNLEARRRAALGPEDAWR